MWQLVIRAGYCPIVYNWMEKVKDDLGFIKSLKGCVHAISLESEWSAARGRRSARDHFARRSSRRSWIDSRALRLRPRRVRRLLRLVKGAAVPVMTRIEEAAGKHITTRRGAREWRRTASGAARFHRGGRDAMRLLHQWNVDLRRGVASRDAASIRRRRFAMRLAPHLCRCGVYLRAFRAVKRAAQ